MAAPAKTTQASPKLSALEQIQKLDAEYAKILEARSQLLESAKEDVLARGDIILAELASLGFEYRLVPADVVIPKARSKAKGSGRGASIDHTPKKGPCPICEFATSPPHDRRTHRWQVNKAPFNAEELAKYELTRI